MIRNTLTQKLLSKNTFLYFGFLILTIGCQKDDTLIQEEEVQVENLKATFISEQEIPSHILGYVEQKTNNTFGVSIGKKGMKLSSSGTNELSRDTPLGKVLTGKVVQVVNEKNIKFTFKVYEPTNANSIINLIVVDMGEHIVEYFIQYVFDDIETHPKLDSGIIDMASFTGTMLVYDNEGQLLGNLGFTEGNNTDSSGSTNPCGHLDLGNDDEDDTPTGGGSPPDGDDDGVDNDYDDTGGEAGNESEENTEAEYSGGASGCEDCGNNEGFDDVDCGIVISYEQCECGGSANGHSASECGCNTGSPTTVTNTCNGSSVTYYQSRNASSKEADHPCNGAAGVLFNLEEIALMKEEIEVCLGDAYNNDYFDTAYPSDVIDIAEYLDGNCTEEAKAFLNLAMDAIEEGGEVDITNEIIKDSTFVDTKADCVYKLLSSTNNNLFKDVMSAFTNNNAKLKLKFQIGSVPDGADGSTSYNSESDLITITFPPSANNLTSLEIAALILHEGIHAELRRIYQGNNQVVEPLPQTQYDYLVSLWNYYRGILPANSVSNYASHTFMVYNHVEPLASAIRQLDDNQYGLNHYMWYGWDGLSDIGKNTIPPLLTNEQEDNYQDLQQITINDTKKQSCDN